MDIAYIAAYPLEQRKMRLAKVLALHPQHPAAVLKMEEVLQHWNSSAEYKAFVHHHAPLGLLPGLSESMVAETCRQIDTRASKLLDQQQQALGIAQNGVNRDNVRAASLSLAEAYFYRGDLQNAGKHITKARESCATEGDMLQVVRSAVRFQMVYDRAAAAQSYLQRLSDQSGEKLSDRDFLYLAVASALVATLSGDVQEAADWLIKLTTRKAAKIDRARRRGEDILPSSLGVDMDSESQKHFGATSDVLTVAVLTILATCDRTRAGLFLNDSDIRQLLSEDAALVELVKTFLECKFAGCIAALAALEPRIQRNYFLMGDVGVRVTGLIRDAAMQVYTSSYHSVALATIAATFQVTDGELERHLRRLIQAGKLAFRIDRAAGYLRATQLDLRGQVVGEVLLRGRTLVDDAEQALRIMALQRNDIVSNYIRAGVNHTAGGSGGLVDERAPRRPARDAYSMMMM